MTDLRYRTAAAAVLATSLWFGVMPADAVAPTPDVRATTVTGACYGGPGRLSLRVLPPVDGENIEVEVTARGLQAGSPWVIGVALALGNGREKRFRRVAGDGRWTVATHFRAPTSKDDLMLLAASAYRRGATHHGCVVLAAPDPDIGLTSCDNPERVAILAAHEKADGSVVIHSLLFGVRPQSAWRLTLAATGTRSRQVTEFDDLASKRGLVRSRVAVQGIDNPRLGLVARSGNGGRCVIGLNPANVTDGERVGVRVIARAARRLAATV